MVGNSKYACNVQFMGGKNLVILLQQAISAMAIIAMPDPGSRSGRSLGVIFGHSGHSLT